MSRSHTHHRDRFVSAVEWAFVIAVLVAIIVAVAAPALGRTDAPRTFSSVKLGAGDSLWSLAASHPVEGLSTGELVEIIRETNDIDSSPEAGQIVLLPTAEHAAPVVCSR